MATPPVELEDFKTYLGVKLADTSLDSQLTEVLTRATDMVESAVGPMVARDQTDVIREVRCGSFILKTWPALEVTDVVDHFTTTALDVSTLDIDLSTGVVAGVPFSRAYDVTASVGRNPVPTPLCEAVLIMGQHLWSTRRGPANGAARFARGGGEDSGGVTIYRGFLWPKMAVEAIQPYLSDPAWV